MKNNKAIRVLFVNAIDLSRDIENLYPPLGPAYLVSYLHKHLGKQRVKFQMITDKFKEKAAKFKPDIVGITCVSQNYKKAKRIAKSAKAAGVPYVLIGGSHISSYPLSLDHNIDIGVIGEGERTFLELMRVFAEKKRFYTTDLSSIKGLIYWSNNKLKLTASRNLIDPLDKIPPPDRNLSKIDSDKAYMFSSRGCPYKCVFCASSRLWKRFRFHSASYVLKEIKGLINDYGVKKINFYDDLFIANKQRVRKLLRLLKKEGLNKKAEFHVSSRSNLIDDEICSLLKQMNVKGISLGLESGSPNVLKYLKGNSVTVEDNFEAIEIIKKHGLYCIASFIIGTPIDTKKTITKTLNFIKRSKLDNFTVYTLTPFPGTPIWEYAQKHGLLPTEPKNIDWDQLDVEYSCSHNHNIHFAKKLTRNELYKLYLLFEKERKKRNILKAGKMIFANPSRLFYHVKQELKKLWLHKYGKQY